MVEPAIGIRMCESMDPGTGIRNKIETGTESDYYLRIKTMMELSMGTRVWMKIEEGYWMEYMDGISVWIEDETQDRYTLLWVGI